MIDSIDEIKGVINTAVLELLPESLRTEVSVDAAVKGQVSGADVLGLPLAPEDLIGKWKSECESLVIAGVDDKIGYNKVVKAMSLLKNTWVAIDKLRKEKKEPYVEAGREIDNRAEHLIDLVKPLYAPLKEMKEKIDDEKERIKKVKEEAKKETYNKRVAEISKVSDFNGVCYSVGSFNVLLTEIEAATDDEFTAYLEEAKVAFDERKQAADAEEQRKKDEALELENQKLEQERIKNEQIEKEAELEKKAKELEEKQQKFLADQKKAHAQLVAMHEKQIEALGFKKSHMQTDSGVRYTIELGYGIKETVTVEYIGNPDEYFFKEELQSLKDKVLALKGQENVAKIEDDKRKKKEADDAAQKEIERRQRVAGEEKKRSRIARLALLGLLWDEPKKLFVKNGLKTSVAEINSYSDEQFTEIIVGIKSEIDLAAEEKKKQREEELKPDKQKLSEFATLLEKLDFPTLADAKAKAIVGEAMVAISKVVEKIRTGVESLG